MKRLMFALAGVAVLAALTALVFGTLGEGGGKVQAHHTVIAVARGDLQPPTKVLNTHNDTLPWLVTHPDNIVTNGDFRIMTDPNCEQPATGPNHPCRTIGEGDDDWTLWTFDFTSCQPTFPLTHASLTLHLTPRDSLITTDGVGMKEPQFPMVTFHPQVDPLWTTSVGSALMNDKIKSLPVLPLGQHATVTQDLLADVSSDAIRDMLNGGTSGEIWMYYSDDAIVSFAKLELGPASCPVGGTTDLLTDGSDAPRSAATGSGTSAPLYAAIAGAAAAAVAMMGAGGWYARRRWMR